ncbi:hypothetical protein BJ875DRAFT_467195 [Amylocarpus encephaloides]|uniref:Uncharacterized protein n=1 Tax=Amylocarpus encephaloides TaxID=45428 RepID=A0A9P7YF49_9HELO|nr:hypothetical protein BJ875DRAFT_467195 [Amylocarpus encephaloides]
MAYKATRVAESGAAQPAFRKRFIIPVWGAQLLIMPPYIVLIAILLSIGKAGSQYGYSPPALVVVNVLINGASLILICLEISLFQYMELRPRFFVISSIVKTVVAPISIGLLAYKLKAEWNIDAQGPFPANRLYLIVVLVFGVLILLAVILSLIYSLLAMKKNTRRSNALMAKYAGT